MLLKYGNSEQRIKAVADQALYDSTSSNQTTICDVAETTYGGTLDMDTVYSDDISDVWCDRIQ
jgi:hypothetical protein